MSSHVQQQAKFELSGRWMVWLALWEMDFEMLDYDTILESK